MELAIRTAMTQLGASLLEQLLSADTGHRGPRIDCGAGHHAQFVGYRDKQVDTVLGRIAVRRAWYHCPVCKRGIAPRDEQLGVTDASLSPGLRAMVARAAAAEPFVTAADLITELSGIALTPKRIERSAEADGAAAAARIAAESAAIARRAVDVLPAPADRIAAPDKLYIAIDGTGVPMVAAAVADRAGKSEDGRARTREVKLAALFTQTRLDTDGRPVRDPDSTSYVGSFAPAERFATLVAAEAHRRGADRIRQLVVLGDGAAWIWNLATANWPEATPIVDIYHARQHLYDLAKPLTSMLGNAHTDWLAAPSMPATSKPSSPKSASSRCPATPPPRPPKRWPTSKPTPTACATPTSATSGFSSAPALWKLAAKPSSVNDSNCPACAGTSPVPPASSRCAASKPATASSASGHIRTTRRPPPDQPDSTKIKISASTYLQICRTPGEDQAKRSCRYPKLGCRRG
ncbi:hypothetical protein LAUMK4_05757 [Mycobacterium persicum]|uniref:ISKra4 family transposase n=1 Tax=Mycobacterium persicum TaxID=1487726 RepID=A0ABY6RST7_9MYCO|nr:hypothetical protein [Mycobacterium persicum]VBA32425.1 hypothetical protein LAUMK4_05757 [Mycobacterium persicum]